MPCRSSAFGSSGSSSVLAYRSSYRRTWSLNSFNSSPTTTFLATVIMTGATSNMQVNLQRHRCFYYARSLMKSRHSEVCIFRGMPGSPRRWLTNLVPTSSEHTNWWYSHYCASGSTTRNSWSRCFSSCLGLRPS